MGQCIDIFHKDPSMQRNILSDPKNMPHQALIQVASETLDLLITAINDKDGNYMGPMLTWSVAPTFTPNPWLSRLSRYSGKVSQSQRIPRRMDSSGIASMRFIMRMFNSRSSGRVGANPNPHCPMVSDVTPTCLSSPR